MKQNKFLFSITIPDVLNVLNSHTNPLAPNALSFAMRFGNILRRLNMGISSLTNVDFNCHMLLIISVICRVERLRLKSRHRVYDIYELGDEKTRMTMDETKILFLVFFMYFFRYRRMYSITKVENKRAPKYPDKSSAVVRRFITA